MGKEKLGEQELEVLRFVSDHDPATVREAADFFAERRGLARTTVLTMMERLRKKGFLLREAGDGGYAYRPAQPKSALMSGLVGDFVERTLGGSLSPFVAYLADRRNATPDEIAQLRRLVEALEEESANDAQP